MLFFKIGQRLLVDTPQPEGVAVVDFFHYP